MITQTDKFSGYLSKFFLILPYGPENRIVGVKGLASYKLWLRLSI